LKRTFKILAIILAFLYLVVIGMDILFVKVKSVKFYIGALFMVGIFIYYALSNNKNNHKSDKG